MGGKYSRHDAKGKSSQQDAEKKHDLYFTLGLNGTGTTTVIQRLKEERGLDNWIPSEYFNNDEILDHTWKAVRGYRDHKQADFGLLYRRFLLGMVFVFDSTDVERLDQAVKQLNQFIHVVTKFTEGTVIMILANKQDMEEAVSPEYIEAKMNEGLEGTIKNSLFVMPCCAVEGNSLLVAYDYFVKQSKLKKEGKLQLGLIPTAWETANQKLEIDGSDDVSVEKEDGLIPSVQESANQKPEMFGSDDVIGEGEKENSSTFAHKMKKLGLKNPFKALKSILFY